ncbi:MAG: YebC/PmpR family DNA-binding transcriptional regulator [Fimbriiglobus sp.]
MAGHSHSANIAVRKGKQDQARAKLFSKLSRYIIIAARNGGGDPDTNLRLRYAIDKARAVSMPKDNIERAVKKGTGELEGVSYDEITYEGYGPNGVAIMVDTLTDNRNRTAVEVRVIFEKNGGNQGLPGCVSYMFDRKGLILIDAKAYPEEDAVMEAAMNADAEDFSREGDVYVVTTDPAKLNTVVDALKLAEYEFIESEVKNLPKNYVDLDVEIGRKVTKLLDALDNHEDVQNVFTNANITDEMADG